MIVSFLLLAGLGAAPVWENTVPVRIVGPWAIEVGPGKVAFAGYDHVLKEAVRFDIEPPKTVHIENEVYSTLPVFKGDAAGWIKGARLHHLRAEECSATGLLIPGSVRLKPGWRDGVSFARGKDYEIDEFWGTFGRIEGGGIAARQTICVNYDYSPDRLDSVVLDREGHARLVKGQPAVTLASPASVDPAKEVTVANIWVPGRLEKLTDDNLFPVQSLWCGLPACASKEAGWKPAPQGETVAEKLLPKTLAKLRAGEPVTIVAFGDSVTEGGGVGDTCAMWYQNIFAALLGDRFPKAKIRMLNAGWGGASSDLYMKAPKGGPYDFERDVLEPKPDLVTLEFVNDAYLDEEGVQKHYAEILERVRGAGAELILITPHLVRPDWMKVASMKFNEDPRPYVKGLRRFAAENNVALADASVKWGHLWHEGLPYITLLANDINHPDARGHDLFAHALIDLFPKE